MFPLVWPAEMWTWCLRHLQGLVALLVARLDAYLNEVQRYIVFVVSNCIIY